MTFFFFSPKMHRLLFILEFELSEELTILCCRLLKVLLNFNGIACSIFFCIVLSILLFAYEVF